MGKVLIVIKPGGNNDYDLKAGGRVAVCRRGGPPGILFPDRLETFHASIGNRTTPGGIRPAVPVSPCE